MVQLIIINSKLKQKVIKLLLQEKEGNGGNSVLENNEDNGEENIEYNQNEEEGGYEEEVNEGEDNGEEMNMEGENENNEIAERDVLQKTLTQKIDVDVMQISEHPNQFYYEENNFCDYKP